MKDDTRVYQYSVAKLVNELWFVFLFILVLLWGFTKLRLGEFSVLLFVMIIPVLMLILIPLCACLVVLSTKLLIDKDKIEKRTLFETKRISWGNVKSIERKHFYVILPDLEKPVDIEIRDRNGTSIRVYRFLDNWEDAEKDITLYSKKDF